MANGQRRQLLGDTSDDITRTVSRLVERRGLSPGTRPVAQPHQRQLRQISFVGGAPGTVTDPLGVAQFRSNLGREPGTSPTGKTPVPLGGVRTPGPFEGGDLPGQTSVDARDLRFDDEGAFTGLGGAVPGPGGTVSTYDAGLAQRRFDEANRIRREFITERDERLQQRRLQDLAFNTPATLDNIASIKAAQKQLLGQTEAQATTRAAQIKAQAEQQLTPAQRQAAAQREEANQIRRAQLGLSRRQQEAREEQQKGTQRRAEEKFRDEKSEASLRSIIGPTEGEGNEANAERLIRTNNLIKASLPKGVSAGERYGDQELKLISQLPDMADVLNNALAREGGRDFPIPFLKFADEPGAQTTIADMLGMLAGREGGVGTALSGALLGEAPNVLLNVGGRTGTEDVDFDAFTAGPMPKAVKERALEAFNQLSNPNNPTARRLVEIELGPEGAREYWQRVTRNRPAGVARGGVVLGE